ncbi:acetyl-CoA C-acyltransferase [Paludisphaera mucosa]|uniref:Acetyl-CoA C-acyltransferase n=1 Tax=Paludisphaera mucosa TaxID=3030827 RepID=A0ABT6F524_9BACT|nr:acetyl-CoA C-acyltransferase [Paludisphaera mucosa]MDG3002609.1 acetyl-CoA C-acyltransferase [Paludisphaera mucosa]
MAGVCIVAAKRTVLGRFLGKLKNLSPVDLACAAARPVLGEVGHSKIDQVIVGNVLGAGQGMNIARQVGVRVGLPPEVPAFTVNMMCGSGLQAVRLAAQAIQGGEAKAILCGGTESMSGSPYFVPRARQGLKLGDAALVDSVLRDGLIDAFDGRHMGLLVEAMAESRGISRRRQDEWALRSQRRFAAAEASGAFAGERVPLEGLEADEHPRPGAALDDLARLGGAFAADGSITAGNSSGINDGAAMLLLADREFAEGRRWPILCDWVDSALVGCEPALMGLGPVYALRRLCERQRLTLAECDAIEINEAFAAQVLACLQDLRVDEESVNRCGGAIALGHPIGASGARLVVHAAHQIHRGAARQAVVSLCVGGGMGVAALLRNPD